MLYCINSWSLPSFLFYYESCLVCPEKHRRARINSHCLAQREVFSHTRLVTLYLDFVLGKKIRIDYKCKGWIEKSIPRIINWHHKACWVITRDRFFYRIITQIMDYFSSSPLNTWFYLENMKSPYIWFISFLYIDSYALGDDARISQGFSCKLNIYVSWSISKLRVSLAP